jgi:hypothetical protein
MRVPSLLSLRLRLQLWLRLHEESTCERPRAWSTYQGGLLVAIERSNATYGGAHQGAVVRALTSSQNLSRAAPRTGSLSDGGRQG